MDPATSKLVPKAKIYYDQGSFQRQLCTYCTYKWLSPHLKKSYIKYSLVAQGSPFYLIIITERSLTGNLLALEDQVHASGSGSALRFFAWIRIQISKKRMRIRNTN